MAEPDTAPTGPDGFYGELPPFTEFAEFSALDTYHPLPGDWVVLIADVVNSTGAIAAGRYKAVNMVGAATIMAVLNVCGATEVPYVFGGDGGTIVVPANLRAAAEEALTRLQGTSQATFGLSLRVGAVPVAQLRALGADVRVRKYQLSERNYLALFAGGGIELADRLLKNPAPDNPYRLPPPVQAEAPDLEGLSCRWEPLAARNGKMLTIMVRATQADSAGMASELGTVIGALADILGRRLQDAAPANERSLRFRWPPRGLWLEARATAGRGGLLRRYLHVLASSLIQFYCEAFDKQAGSYDAPAYRQELRANTDFRKYDDVLRLVLDVTPAQADAIESYLAREFEAGQLIYGTHLANAALMTCLMFDLAQSRHIHFIDGAGGGFASAAVAFKARAAEAET